MNTLPRPIDWQTPVSTMQELALRVFRWARDIDEHVRTRPSLEIVRFDVDPASLPLVVSCQTPNVRGVVRALTISKTNSALVSNTDLAWRQAADGVQIEALPGTSSGTTYGITLLVIGENGNA